MCVYEFLAVAPNKRVQMVKGKKAENLLEVASVLTIICFRFYGLGLQYNLPIM